MITSLLHNAALKATTSLIMSLKTNLPGTWHEMLVPSILPDGQVITCRKRSRTFPRATLLEALLDAKDMDITVARGFIAGECQKLMTHRRKDTRGGWSYFEDHPELPPDLDDAGTVIRTLLRADKPRFAAGCQEIVQFCLSTFENNGSANTWILDADSPTLAAMRSYMRLIKLSDGCHAEVLANFLTAARCCGIDKHKLNVTAGYLLSRQQSNGSWETDFYGSPCYATMTVLIALRSLGLENNGTEAGNWFLKCTQEANGSWENGDVLATACALTGLLVCHENDDCIHQGLQFLLRTQKADGLWDAGTFVRVITPSGLHEQKSRELTTAYCLKAIATFHRSGHLSWFDYD